MKNKDIAYLNSLPDVSQYPAARCAMNLHVYAVVIRDSGVNEQGQQRNESEDSVDLLNACILLIKLEVNR